MQDPDGEVRVYDFFFPSSLQTVSGDPREFIRQLSESLYSTTCVLREKLRWDDAACGIGNDNTASRPDNPTASPRADFGNNAARGRRELYRPDSPPLASVSPRVSCESWSLESNARESSQRVSAVADEQTALRLTSRHCDINAGAMESSPSSLASSSALGSCDRVNRYS